MRFFCLSNWPLPAELPRAKEGEEQPKFITTVYILWYPPPPLHSHECWNHNQNLCHAPMTFCQTRYYLLAFTHTLVSSPFLRICFWIHKGQININHTFATFVLAGGRQRAVAWSTDLISITLVTVAWAILLEEICCFYHWEQWGKSQRTRSKKVPISTAKIILPFIQANCISEAQQRK